MVILISAVRAVFSSARVPIAQFLKTPLCGRVAIYTPWRRHALQKWGRPLSNNWQKQKQGVEIHSRIWQICQKCVSWKTILSLYILYQSLLVARRATYVVDGRFFGHYFWKVEGTVRIHVNSRVAHVWLPCTVINVQDGVGGGFRTS